MIRYAVSVAFVIATLPVTACGESRDPDAVLYVGQFLAQNAVAQNLRVGPNGEVPEPSAFLGAFSLVACDVGQDCTSLHRDLQQACAYGGYCGAENFEQLYQNFLASPWAYTNAIRYRNLIHTALRDRNYGLIGLTRTAALEGGEHGITVNAICPAYVRTPLVDSQIEDQAKANRMSPGEVIEKIMLAPAAVKRLIEPREVADFVAYLCSEPAGTITGAALTMDLGWTAR